MRSPVPIRVFVASYMLFLTLLVAGLPVRAQQPTSNESDEMPGATPRAAITQFLRAARDGDLRSAARFIGHPERPMPNRERLAGELRAVLDRELWLDPSTLSDRPEGRLDDGLAPHVEEIGRIPTSEGPAPVRLVRLPSGQWVFGRETLARVPGWYANLPHRWLYERLPAPLLRAGPYEVAYWQWLALPVLVIVAAIVGRAVGVVLHMVLATLVRRTLTTLDDELLTRLSPARNLFLTSLATYAMVPYLQLPPRANASCDKLVLAVLIAAFFWALVRSVDVARAAIEASRFASNRPALRALLPLGTKIIKVVLAAISVVALLQWFGLPVASLIAGLGIGGLAVALAAKSTLENLIASVTLGIDQPFRPGDLVKLEDTLGTVESVGLRSTRIRTLDRTLVTVPNGKLADMRIESYSARDRMRLSCVLGLTYGTSAAQMREVLTSLERVLRAQPKIWPDELIVRFKQFGDSSLDIEVMAWFQTSDWYEFLAIRQEVYLAFMGVVEAAGASFAFPTRTLHIVDERMTTEPIGRSARVRPDS